MRDLLFSAIMAAIAAVVYVQVRPWLFQYLALVTALVGTLPVW